LADHPRTDLAPAPQALRVMVVDDNRDAADTVGMLLEGLGHEVSVAHDPAQALEAVREAPFSAFVLDIGLPQMDGYALARELRAHPNGRAATFIALTGYGSSADRQRGDAAGFHHYLVKPADLGELVRLLQSSGRQDPP
jgi:CheY-like chemotaxis protein